MGSKRGREYPRASAARGTRNSQTAQGAAFSEKLIRLLKKGPSYVRFVYRAKLITDNRIYYWLQDELIKPVVYPIAFRISRRHWRFTFNGLEYHYFYHPYNCTWRNERSVELPIVREETEKLDAERTLELGNVLSHYYEVHHDVVDKHEKGDGIITSDICDFHTAKTYDLIVSISTIEHIGVDEDYPVGLQTEVQPDKCFRVIQLLKGLLSEKGKLVVTVPLGYNLALDLSLKKDTRSIWTRKAYLKRISKSNKWAEVEETEIHDAKYDSPFNYGNVLAICIFESSPPATD